MPVTRGNSGAWQLEPAAAGARMWLVGLSAVLPVVITGIALGFAVMSGDEMSLIAGNLPLTIGLIMVGIAVFGGAIALVIDLAMRRHRITVDADGIEVATTFYKRRLGWSELQLDQGRVVNLDEHVDLKPRWKTNGTEIPGFKSGWFRLRNRKKALVAMTRGPRMVWIPTTNDYGLLLQPRQPQALLDHLRATAPRR